MNPSGLVRAMRARFARKKKKKVRSLSPRFFCQIDWTNAFARPVLAANEIETRDGCCLEFLSCVVLRFFFFSRCDGLKT
jgi:hypothetical protein